MEYNTILLSKINQDKIDQYYDIIKKDSSNLFISFDKLAVIINSNKENSFIVTKGNDLIGAFFCGLRENTGYILFLYVIDNFRNQGLAKYLMNYGLKLLKTKGANEIYLEVMQNNDISVNIYKKYGFVVYNEIYTLRNENNSFYIKEKKIILKKNNSLLLIPIFLQFKEKIIKYKDSLYYSKLIENNLAEFYTILFQQKTIGYLIFSRNKNCLNILDIGFETKYIDSIFEAISAVLQNEKIVTIQVFPDDKEQYQLFIKNGFFVDIKQYIMKLTIRMK